MNVKCFDYPLVATSLRREIELKTSYKSVQRNIGAFMVIFVSVFVWLCQRCSCFRRRLLFDTHFSFFCFITMWKYCAQLKKDVNFHEFNDWFVFWRNIQEKNLWKKNKVNKCVLRAPYNFMRYTHSSAQMVEWQNRQHSFLAITRY